MIDKIKKMLSSYTAKDLFWVTSGNFLQVIFGFIFTILVARNLTPSAFGIFATLTSLILILSDLGELGIGGGLSNFLPPLLQNKNLKNERQILKTTFLFQFLTAFLLMFLLWLFDNSFANVLFHSGEYHFRLLLQLSGLGVFGFMTFNFINSALFAKEQFRKSFLVFVFYTIPRTLLLGIVLLFIKLNLFLVLLLFILGSFLGFLIGSFYLPLNFLSEKGFYPLKKIFHFSLFLAANKVFVALFSRLDIVMLSSLSGSLETGLYSAASRIAFIYPLLGGSLGTVLAPKYARLSQKEAVNYTKKVYLLILSIVLSVLLMIVFSPFIIQVFGASYQEASPILQLLLLVSIPFLLAIPTNNLLTYTIKKPQILAFSSLVQLIIIFIFNLFLIPKFGGLAPAISIGLASVVAMLISFLSTVFLIRR